VQRLKEDVRARIIEAAAAEFAAAGYLGAKVAQIAERAALSTGNIYRYFKSKEDILDAVLDDDFIARFVALLDARVEALASLRDMQALDADAAAAQGAMLDLWIAHRLRVVVLLDRVDGSRFEGFAETFFVKRLSQETLKHLQQAKGGVLLGEPIPATLDRIFHNARRAIVSMLEANEDADDIRRDFAAFWSFQIAGIAGFKAWVLA
jgi:AcrR family transcriptional regulator